MNMDHWWL